MVSFLIISRRQVIYGCMGAIGYFLFMTGIDFVVSGMETKTPNLHLFTGISIKILSLSNKIGLIVSSTPAMVILGIALFAAILAALLQRHKITSSNPFIIPSICMLLVAGFYLALLFSGTSIGDARDAGWILESPNEEAHTKEGFWHLFSFYKYFFQFSKIDWSIIPKLFPTFLGMVTFALINVPINVPAFAAATSQKPLLQTELKLHGFSNVAGFLGGGLANYFTFSNSLLFFQSGGNLSRKSGYLVAFFTFLGLFFIYYDFFNFLPKFVPVFLVFYLTIELFWEAFIKSYYYLYDKRELCTIVIIVAIASTVGFSEGLFVGLGVAFLDTVLKLASVPISDMAYPPMSISRDVHQIKIGGFLFFGNMDQMVEIFRQLIPLLESNESTTLILDFRGLIGWDLTYQLEFKSMTDQYRTLFSHPSISWLMIGSPRHCAFLKRAGWIQSSREEILVSGHEESSENIDDTIRFQYIAALVDLDMALLNHEEISGKNTNRNIFDK